MVTIWKNSRVQLYDFVKHRAEVEQSRRVSQPRHHVRQEWRERHLDRERGWSTAASTGGEDGGQRIVA